jgi:hypothetical protein
LGGGACHNANFMFHSPEREAQEQTGRIPKPQQPAMATTMDDNDGGTASLYPQQKTPFKYEGLRSKRSCA